jgi:serine/threonine-protein kinase
MDPERWERVKELFGRLLESPPERREEELASAAEEPEVVAQVRRLLAAAERGAGEVFEQGALAAVPELREAWQTAVPGRSIGPYRLVSELGRGGMGAVYLGVREGADFNQRVAIKLIKRGMDTEEIVRRFLRERRILAGLSHPNIARLLDGGATEDGRPYFILEHVEGQPITTWAQERGLDVEARLRLFLKVCAAVQVAHQSLIVHRDLKPANVLVGADGEPKLLDFGIAKLLEPGEGATALTGRETPRTPEYASPEQLAGGPVTTAVDVYGLGILLFELLTGLAPGAAARRLGPGWDERLPSQVVCALDPRDAGSRRRARRLQGDLDAIVRKALEPEPHRRYGTAAALAEDIERHLAQQPIAARRPTLLYRLGRTLARHKLASAAVLGLLLLAATASYQAFELARQHRRVEGERRRALALAEFLQGLFRSADPDQNRGAVLTAREVLAVGSRRLLDEPGARPRWWAAGDAAPALEPRTRADLLQAVGEVQASLGLSPEARRLLTQALALRAAPAGSTDRADREKAELEQAETLSHLGEVALLASDYPAARHYYREAVARKRRLLGPRALPLAGDWNGLGLLATDPAAAEPCFRWALTIARGAGAPGREELATSLNNLGKLALDRDDFAAARHRFAEALALRREVLGDDHPDTVQARSNLASTLFRLGQYDRAEAVYQEIVAIRRHLLGPDHPVLARTLSSLAVVQQQRGRLAAAEASLREALAMRRRLGLAPDEAEADTLNSLAVVLRKQGRLDEAERIYQESFALYGRLLGAGGPRQANVLNGLARVHRQRADLPGAERLARQALGLLQQRSEAPATVLADTWALLGEILAAEARTAESAAAWRRCLELRTRSLPPDHPALAEARRALEGLSSPTR